MTRRNQTVDSATIDAVPTTESGVRTTAYVSVGSAVSIHTLSAALTRP